MQLPNVKRNDGFFLVNNIHCTPIVYSVVLMSSPIQLQQNFIRPALELQVIGFTVIVHKWNGHRRYAVKIWYGEQNAHYKLLPKLPLTHYQPPTPFAWAYLQYINKTCIVFAVLCLVMAIWYKQANHDISSLNSVSLIRLYMYSVER